MTAVAHPVTRPAVIRPAVTVLLRRTARWMLVGFGAVAGVYVLIIAGMATFGRPETSVWASSGWVLQWLALGGGIALASYLPVLVASGLTRRTVTIAGAVALCGLAAGLAVLVQMGLAIEAVAYRAAGLSYAVDGSHLFATTGQVQLVLAEFGLMFAGFLTSGWLLWTGYYRGGWWRGTLALPLVMVPGFGTLGALSLGWVGPVDEDSPAWVATTSIPPAVALGLLLVAAGLLAVGVLIHRIPVHTA